MPYFADHQTQVGGGWPGLLVLNEDFGEAGVPDVDHKQIALDDAYECIRVLDEARFRTRATDNEAAWSQIGSIADYLHDIAEARLPNLYPKAEPAPEPEPPPPPVQSLDWYGALTHWNGSNRAMDLYVPPSGGGGRWIRCALRGRIERAASITPLAADHEYRICFEQLGETMETAVLRADDGNSYAFSHVAAGSLQLGPYEPWGPMAQVGRSGIASICRACGFECLPDHTHFFGFFGHGPVPSDGMGSVPARDLLPKLGWTLVETLPQCASPNQYMACQIQAGRKR